MTNEDDVKAAVDRLRKHRACLDIDPMCCTGSPYLVEANGCLRVNNDQLHIDRNTIVDAYLEMGERQPDEFGFGGDGVIQSGRRVNTIERARKILREFQLDGYVNAQILRCAIFAKNVASPVVENSNGH